MDVKFSLKNKHIWVTGHKGMVGSAVVRRLASEDCHVITTDRKHLDLCRQQQVEDFLSKNHIDAIFHIAAKVGGIVANQTYPAEFIYNNLMIEANVINAAWQNGVKNLLFVGSNCNYPKNTEQPVKETALLSGTLDESIQWYAIAKIAGIKLCQAYRRQYGFDCISVMPANLFGPGDNYDPLTNHVVAGIIRRIHEAKVAGLPSVVIWGSGKPLREFLFVDDLADAMVYIMKHYSQEEQINIGTGWEMTIADFAQTAAEVIGFQGHFEFDTTKPDGTLRKLLDCSKLKALGWQPQTDLKTALKITYEWFLKNSSSSSSRKFST